MTSIPNPKIRANPKDLDLRVKEMDEDRWLASRYASAEQREKLIVLYALFLELERALSASEALLGRIRVQWWREVVDQIYSSEPVRQHDLALALEAVIVDQPDVRQVLEAMLDAFDDVVDETENADLPPRLETGAKLALAAALLIDPIASEHADTIEKCGRAYVASHTGSACSEARLDEVNELFKSLPHKLAPATAYVSIGRAYAENKEINAIYRRWRVFKTVLTGKI